MIAFHVFFEWSFDKIVSDQNERTLYIYLYNIYNLYFYVYIPTHYRDYPYRTGIYTSRRLKHDHDYIYT